MSVVKMDVIFFVREGEIGHSEKTSAGKAKAKGLNRAASLDAKAVMVENTKDVVGRDTGFTVTPVGEGEAECWSQITQR